jgi:hypothetical protein
MFRFPEQLYVVELDVMQRIAVLQIRRLHLVKLYLVKKSAGDEAELAEINRLESDLVKMERSLKSFREEFLAERGAAMPPNFYDVRQVLRATQQALNLPFLFQK